MTYFIILSKCNHVFIWLSFQERSECFGTIYWSFSVLSRHYWGNVGLSAVSLCYFIARWVHLVLERRKAFAQYVGLVHLFFNRVPGMSDVDHPWLRSIELNLWWRSCCCEFVRHFFFLLSVDGGVSMANHFMEVESSVERSVITACSCWVWGYFLIDSL